MPSKGFLTQCENYKFCGHTIRLQKPEKWTCDECVSKNRRKTLEIPAVPWGWGSI